MALIYALIALATGFVLGYIVGGATSDHVSPFSKADAKEGRDKISARIEKRKARIMERAQKQGKIVNDDVEDLFCISDHTARNYLGELEAEGKLTQHGAGGGTFYTPTH